MNSTKELLSKIFAVILIVIFIIFNLLHVVYPYWLISEDIKAGTVHGTGMEMAALLPWMLEFISVPFVLCQLVYYAVFRKSCSFKAVSIMVFALYVFQVALFNVLLWL
ncbi:MAG: hypothetical protein E7589_02700 [Ruminococcaceae bacterium]|nr:hypothetical protein [Oscillospiraceae bacterium]